MKFSEFIHWLKSIYSNSMDKNFFLPIKLTVGKKIFVNSKVGKKKFFFANFYIIILLKFTIIFLPILPILAKK